MTGPHPSHRTSATLSDGSTVSGEIQHVARAVQFDLDWRTAEAEWIERLRSAGVKAAHPDDGWVDRDHPQRVVLCYPQFNDGLAVGDRLALGWPDRFRVVRITRTEEGGPLIRPMFPGPYYWYFTENIDG